MSTQTVTPRRVQRTRRPGGGIPEGAVYVGRPSKWGNSFHTHGDGSRMTPELAVQSFREFVRTQGGFFPNDGPRWRTSRGQRQVEKKPWTTVAEIQRELRGHDLACWCPLTDAEGRPVPCHADVLLEIANA
jgi:hypothetical protein